DRVRVVVTVGIATGYPFRRLIAQLIPLLSADGELSRATGRPVTVLWQTAGTPCGDLPIDATSALPSAELSAALAEADIVISHAGTGSAATIFGSGRYPVLVPRRLSHGEAGDEHQTELAAALAHRNLCRSVEADAITVDDLLQTLSRRIRQLPVTPLFELQR
ncbi:MAG: glycosyltransferase family 28, partial [Actinomycetota bacterium]|nr:glycosyltransferase family 28 [Actinomycetota bacterium]